MGTLTTLDPATIEGLDFDIELPCESRAHDGDGPAVWAARFERECCGVTVLTICEPCRLLLVEYERQIEAFLARASRPVVCLCGRCGRRFDYRRATITPLRGEGS